MKEHLFDHEKMIQILQHFNKLNVNLIISDDRIRSCVYGFQNCAYCVCNIFDLEKLVAHINKLLFSSECYYRTIDIGMCAYHFNTFHSNCNEKTILLCDLTPKFIIPFHI